MKYSAFVLLVIVGMLLAACAPATTMPLITPQLESTTSPGNSADTAVPPAAVPAGTEAAAASAAPQCVVGSDLFPAPEADVASALAAIPPVSAQDHMRGNPEAKITILEYSDFM